MGFGREHGDLPLPRQLSVGDIGWSWAAMLAA